MSDMVNEINDYARYGVDDEGFLEQIKQLFEKLVEDSIIGDVVEAWDLFHWLKIEKQAFNNIQWYKVYRETAKSLVADLRKFKL